MNAPTINTNKINNTSIIAGPSPLLSQLYMILPPLFVFSFILYGKFFHWFVFLKSYFHLLLSKRRDIITLVLKKEGY